jgi:Methyltransferase domain
MRALLSKRQLRDLGKIVMGFNAASLRHLFGSAPAHFLRACKRAASAAWQDGGPRERKLHGSLSQIPEVALEKILNNRAPLVSVAATPYEDGMLPIEQAIALLSILVVEAPAEVLEIGTFFGNTTKLMAENLPAATIHTVDLPESYSPKNDPAKIPKDDPWLIKRRSVGKEFKDHRCKNRIKQHFVDTATWDFHEAAGATFFFIDGSHTYEYCKNDSDKCFALCGGQGIFVWHDCDDNHPGVLTLLSEWRRLGRDVIRIAGTPLAYWNGKHRESRG